MRYILRIYKYGRFSHDIRGKGDVLPRFHEDIQNCKPCNVKHNKNTVSVAFYDGKYTVVYTLPTKYFPEV